MNFKSTCHNFLTFQCLGNPAQNRRPYQVSVKIVKVLLFTFCHESDLKIIDDLMLAASLISCILLVIKMFRCVEKCSQIENYPRPSNTGSKIDVLSLSD